VSFIIHSSQNRREFVRAAAAALTFPNMGRLLAKDASPRRWRTFEVTTTVEVIKPSGPTRVWVPAALCVQTPYQRTLADTFRCEGAIVRTVETKTDGLKIIAVEFPAGVRPFLGVTSRVKTRDWAVNFSAAANEKNASASELRHFLRPTKLLPTDGIVRETAMQITRRWETDLDKARAIYEWIVENTFRDPKTRGCGIGDIRFMLESRDLGGKCADLNALFVGLARAAGVPARDTYGIRVAKSELGYVSLGVATENISKAQHCRAEAYLNDYGWTPVDPADVRKVVLEEPPGGRPFSDEMVKGARARLFGSWEMNWIAYNFAHDVALPGSSGPTIGFLMYPQAETADGRLDCLNPDTFRYEIRAKEIRV
jgi:transglutaminase-like putative cysteine protease